MQTPTIAAFDLLGLPRELQSRVRLNMPLLSQKLLSFASRSASPEAYYDMAVELEEYYEGVIKQAAHWMSDRQFHKLLEDTYNDMASTDVFPDGDFGTAVRRVRDTIAFLHDVYLHRVLSDTQVRFSSPYAADYRSLLITRLFQAEMFRFVVSVQAIVVANCAVSDVYFDGDCDSDFAVIGVGFSTEMLSDGFDYTGMDLAWNAQNAYTDDHFVCWLLDEFKGSLFEFLGWATYSRSNRVVNKLYEMASSIYDKLRLNDKKDESLIPKTPEEFDALKSSGRLPLIYQPHSVACTLILLAIREFNQSLLQLLSPSVVVVTAETQMDLSISHVSMEDRLKHFDAVKKLQFLKRRRLHV
jgi:hypothetical protein